MADTDIGTVYTGSVKLERTTMNVVLLSKIYLTIGTCEISKIAE